MSKAIIDFSTLQTISEQNLQLLKEIFRLNISYDDVKIPTPPHNFPVFVKAVAFDPPGERIAIGAYDGGAYGYVSIWSLKEGEHYFLEPPTMLGTVYSLAWSPDTRQLATGGTLGHVGVWDVRTRQQIVTLRGSPGPKNYVRGLSFSPDGKLLVSGDAYATLRIFDADTYEQIKLLEYYVTSNIAFMGNGTHFGCGIFDWHADVSYAAIFDVTGQQVKTFEFGKNYYVDKVRFSHNNELLFAHGRDEPEPNKGFEGVKIWNLISGEFVSQYSTYGLALEINNTDKLLFLKGDADKKEIESTIEVWNWRKKERLVNIHTGSGSTDLALNQQNTLIAMPDNQGDWNTLQQSVVLYGIPIE